MKITHAPCLFSLIGSVICAVGCLSAHAEIHYYSDGTIYWN